MRAEPRAPIAERLRGTAGPAVALAVASLGFGMVLALLTGGREVADDAPRLILLARNPWALFGDYQAVGITPNFGSYPPLLPALYGMLVRPWLALFGDFWGVRLGALCWSLAALATVPAIARSVGAARPDRQLALWTFALLPSVWGAISLIPQEEAYVALFGVALYLAAAHGHRALLVPLFLLAVLAGKYFLLILALPLAVLSPRPVRNLALYVAPCVAALGLYVAYHALAFEHPPPIVSHVIDPGSSISIYALLWQLGVQPEPELIKLVSVPITGLAVLGLCGAARARGLDLLSTVTASLYLTLLTLSITFPAYVLWVLPFAAVSVARIPERAHRLAGIGLLLLWGVGEWGANLVRGVALALTVERGAAKTAVADAARRVLGESFPYHEVHVLLLLVVIVSGVALISLVWRSALRAQASGPDAESADTLAGRTRGLAHG